MMLTTVPMKDEVARGYRGRLIRLGHYPNQKVAIRALKQHVADLADGRSDLPVVHLLAEISGLTSEEFCRQHTMLPFLRAVTNTQSDLLHGDVRATTISHGLGMALPGAGAFACRRCVEQDLDTKRYSWFRRTQQLPMLIRCEEHREPLVWSSSDQAFLDSPSVIIRSPDPLPYKLNPDFGDYPVVSRYVAIAKAWLQRAKPIPLTQLHLTLRSRAKFLGLRTAERGVKPLLSNLALDVCPVDWLDVFLPGLGGKERGVFRTTLDSLVKHGCIANRSSLYALALALLYESADEALTLTMTPSPPELSANRKPVGQQSGLQRRKRFINYYKATRGHVALIAEHAGINRRTQREWMLKNGFPPLTRFSDTEIRAFLDYSSGMTLGDACQKHKVSQLRVENLSRAGAVPLANVIRAMAL